MKRKLQRILSAALAMVLAVGMTGLSVSADNAALPPTEGTLTIHKFLMDDITQANAPNTGKKLDDSEIPSTAVPINGITFRIQRLDLEIDNDGNVTGSAATSGKIPTNATEVTADMIDATFNSNTGYKDVTTQTVGSEVGVTPAETLPRGMYLITEYADATGKVSSPAAPFLVSVPMTDPENNASWITDVHVYPKNETMSVSKSVKDPGNKDATTDILDSFAWHLDASVPSNIYLTPENAYAPELTAAELTQDHLDEIDRLNSSVIKFNLFDVLGPNLMYVKSQTDGDTNGSVGPVKVYKIGSLDDTATPVEIPQTASGYTGNIYNIVEPDFTGTLNANTLRIEFTEEGRRYLLENEVKFIRMSFYTKVILADDDEFWNAAIENKDAGYEYTNRFDEEKEGKVPDSEAPEVHTGKIAIEKVDINDNTVKLVGAEFKIARTKADAIAKNYITDKDGNDLIAKTDDGSGGYQMAVFYGLQYGAAKGEDADTATSAGVVSYWIVETKSPDGYNLLNEPKEVKINLADSDLRDENGKLLYIAKIPVQNSKGFTLPSTGDNMALLLTIAGVLISGAAILYLVLSKKKRNA